MLESEALGLTHRRLGAALPVGRPVRVLEAGGGSYTLIKVERPQHVTVVDLSPEQLARNTYAHEKILGDLHDANALSGEYDLIVCWDVLEHLADPALAFANMAERLSPGGLLVIGCPNLYSIKGLVTRFTPHWFHVFYYRRFRGEPLAGEPGRPPFPTYLRLAMSLPRLVKLATKLGLETQVAETYRGPALDDLRDSHPKLFGAYSTPGRVARGLSGGRIDPDATEYVAVFRRPAREVAERAAA